MLVDFRFRHMDHDAFYAMLQDSQEKKESSVDFLARFVDGWEGDTINASFSLEALARLVKNYPKSAQVIFRVFESELIGAIGKN